MHVAASFATWSKLTRIALSPYHDEGEDDDEANCDHGKVSWQIL